MGLHENVVCISAMLFLLYQQAEKSCCIFSLYFLPWSWISGTKLVCFLWKKKVWVLHSVWFKFLFSWIFPRLPVLNTALHKKSSWQINKILTNSELVGYHCPVAKPAAMANKHPYDAEQNFSSLMAWCISCNRVTMSHSSNGSSH